MSLVVKKRKYQSPEKQFWWYLLAGLLLIVAAALTLLSFWQKSHSEQRTYNYNIDQLATSRTIYFDNSYFTDNSLATGAYIQDLTDKIELRFNYLYQADQAANLTYSYAANTQVRAVNTPRGETTSQVVWQQNYSLLPAVSQNINGQQIKIDETIEVPFRDYAKQISQLNKDLILALDGVVEVNFSVNVTGTIDGKKINDNQTIKMSTPLTSNIFSPQLSYDKKITKSIELNPTEPNFIQKYNSILVGVLLVAAVVCVILGINPWRDSKWRSPYQRELARIYRYHDGIIIKTNRPIDTANREIISVESFDDLLNLSDELHAPIIASKLSEEATRFVVLHENALYAFVLGRVPQDHALNPLLGTQSSKVKRPKK